MKKIFVILVLFGILLFGCIDQKVSSKPSVIDLGEKNTTSLGYTISSEDDYPSDLISSSGDAPVSQITIRSTNIDGRKRFLMVNYTDHFVTSGIYSDAFIKLNNSQFKTLGNEESLWLTILFYNETMPTLFNTIYLNEPKTCNSDKISILGKNYLVSSLVDKGSFENDDKWKVSLVREGNCLKRIVVYQYGYFYDLKENEQINLIRNDNRLLFYLENTKTNPTIKLVGTSR